LLTSLSPTIERDLDGAIGKPYRESLQKLQLYLEVQAAGLPADDERQVLLVNSREALKAILTGKEGRQWLLDPQLMASVMRDVLAPLIEYDQKTKLTLEKYKDGKYVPESSKLITELFPESFVKTTLQIKSDGTFPLLGETERTCGIHQPRDGRKALPLTKTPVTPEDPAKK
jgi:hypothetical protein